MKCRFLVTCEHGGNRIPARYRKYFSGQEDLLQSHRGHDPGALAMARDLARRLPAPLVYSVTSRLVVDLNRTLGHPRLHGAAILALPAEARREVVERHYLPYRDKAEAMVAAAVQEGCRVVHFSSHSFTPVLDGVVRRADVGLLYDPSRPGEAALCREWLRRLKAAAPALRVRRNYPYTGRSDGFTAYLRRCFDAGHYLGIELEINQAWVSGDRKAWRRLRFLLVDTLGEVLSSRGCS